MRSEGARSRLARLLDFLDQEEAEPGTATWQESGHHLHKPDSGDQDDNAEESLAHNLRDVEDFFSAGHTYGQNVRRPAAAEREKQQKCKPPGAHREPSITVPQPFKMTLRDAQKKDKSVTMDLLDSLDFKNQEDPECLKQFRAQPVPAHVLLPLYNDLVEEEEERRKSAIQKRKDLLVATQKPFQFLSKEEEKRKQEIERPVTVPTETTQSIRRSIPKSVLDPQISEKLKEAELVRKIQSQMRAKAILEKSAAPIPLSRGIRDPCSSISLKNQQECLGFLQQNLTFQPHIKPAVPDFQRLYRKFQGELPGETTNPEQTLYPADLQPEGEEAAEQHTRRRGDWPHCESTKSPRPGQLVTQYPARVCNRQHQEKRVCHQDVSLGKRETRECGNRKRQKKQTCARRHAEVHIKESEGTGPSPAPV
uniref:Protein FAM161B n=1 Tax=Leptobrachium leishanense TaxID=445787 RepID=A0A8C5PM84_9ANUR